MNTPRDEDRGIRYAEYALGVLDADARAEIEREIEDSPGAAAEVARWQQRLLPLAEDVAPVAPPANLWLRLSAGPGNGAQRPAKEPSRSTLWNNLSLWRGMAFAAGLLAITFIGVTAFLVQTLTPPSPEPASKYMATTLEQDNGLPGWTATIDPTGAHVVLVPAAPAAIPAGRVPELWLIPAGGKPIAIGVFVPDRANTLSLRRDLLTRLNAQSLLAVSLEPPGGSPTGQPTGPVVAKGALSGS